MEIRLTPEESEEYFYNALCNGLDQIHSYGISTGWNDLDYKESRDKLISEQKDACYEDILMEILKSGKTILFIDEDGGNDDYNVDLTLQMIHERVQLTPIKHLIDMIYEDDDADTADIILQTVLYNEVVFG